jgi:hypothetical protein
VGIRQTSALRTQAELLGFSLPGEQEFDKTLLEFGTEHLTGAAIYLGAHRIWRERNADAKGTTS